MTRNDHSESYMLGYEDAQAGREALDVSRWDAGAEAWYLAGYEAGLCSKKQ